MTKKDFFKKRDEQPDAHIGKVQTEQSGDTALYSWCFLLVFICLF